MEGKKWSIGFGYFAVGYGKVRMGTCKGQSQEGRDSDKTGIGDKQKEILGGLGKKNLFVKD